MKENEFVLPLVDFNAFTSSSNSPSSFDIEKRRKETAQEINRANSQHGFVCLYNTGITKQQMKQAFATSQDLFHSYTENEKKTLLKPINPQTNTGYIGMEGESLNRERRPDLKEAFNIRQHSFSSSSSDNNNNNNDLMGTSTHFQNTFQDLWNDLHILGQQFALCCAMALGLDDDELDYFSKTLEKKDLCTLRMIHYPPCLDYQETENDEKDSKDEVAIRVGEHTDFGIFTFLFIHDFQDDSSLGFQIKNPFSSNETNNDEDSNNNNKRSSGEWNDVVFDKNSLSILLEENNEGIESSSSSCPIIVNTGALMARWTNDLWKATMHRVIVSPKAFNSHRYTIAAFFDPDKDTLCSVHPKFVADGQESKYEPINSFDYLLMKLKEAQEG